ncbi:hypothetical protein HK105_200375 [Polyrhizophydium stewartii]|uniref:Enoyl reductase (ER) domain-containing protein n=1 Tax=Polyrhizophydium stewartii TaxID=2732419 RepID=A0ABR4NL94_9FUNG|nr:hypothetical protein HK105_001904 [Polyrhizophydium stewartii]
MRAVQIHETGGPANLVLAADVATPACGPNDVLVRNHFSGVNFIDTYHRSGLYKVPLPYVPGREAAGLVEAVGANVRNFKPGDRVAYFSSGSYAEFSAVPEGYVVHLPDSVSFETGASMLLQGLTAMGLACIAHNTKPGEFALVYAAAGGTGQMLVQVCKELGATVIGITSTADKAAIAREAGADHVITYATEDIAARVAEITGGKGANVIFDGVGKSSFDTSLACIARLGSLLSFGNASGKVDPIDIMKLVPKQIRLMRPSLFGLITTPEDFQKFAKELVEHVRAGTYKIAIHKIYDLADAPVAHTDLESGKTTGKLILRI